MCNSCTSKEFKESLRIHGRPPRKFFICLGCGNEVQGVYNIDGTIHEFSTSVSRGGTNKLGLRLSDTQMIEFKTTGKTSREIFLLGLETYKNHQNTLKSN